MAPNIICAGCKKQAKINENLLCERCTLIFSPIVAMEHIESELSELPVKNTSNDQISESEKLKNENLELKNEMMKKDEEIKKLRDENLEIRTFHMMNYLELQEKWAHLYQEFKIYQAKHSDCNITKNE